MRSRPFVISRDRFVPAVRATGLRERYRTFIVAPNRFQSLPAAHRASASPIDPFSDLFKSALTDLTIPDSNFLTAR